ncbi:MAG: hypothetical protein J0L60_03830 [Ignavibacteria bacterium]|nr:hypothetical protein [Ignavibacteria bacterium]
MESAGNSRTPNFDEIESYIEKVRDVVNLNHSRGLILSSFDHLLSLLDSASNPLLIESSFTEFFPLYLKLLGWYHPLGQNPSGTKKLITNAKVLYRLPSGEFKSNEFKAQILRIEEEYRHLISFLKGKETSGDGEIPLFPVIESAGESFGFTHLDSLEVKVAPSKSGTRFIIHPTYKDEDTLLVEQVRTSFEAALSMIPAEKKKKIPFFEVQVFFASMLGIYSGNSFGSLLTTLLYVELTRIFNTNLVLSLAPRLAFTGATDISGGVKPVGKRHIARKTRAVFYSGVSRFIVTKADEIAALAEVSKLQKRMPERNFEVMGVNNISEIINRRDILRISRKPLKERVIEGAQKYRYGSLILLPFLVLLGFLYAREFDTNPVSFELDKTDLKIKNKYGAVLWSWVVHQNIGEQLNIDELKTRIRILDVNNDGENEVLASGEFIYSKDVNGRKYFYCFNSGREELWRVTILDTVSSPKESNMPAEYHLTIYDTVTIDGKMRLLLGANNISTYPSALFTINPETGQRVSGTIWNAGFIHQVGVVDANSDGKRDIVFLCTDNGLNFNKIAAVEFPFKDGMLETRPDYFLHGKKKHDPVLEISLVSTDYTVKITHFNRDNFMARTLYPDETGRIGFFSRFTYSINHGMYKLVVNTKTHEIDYFIEGAFRSNRDSLVKAGTLPLPYTDTKEYTDILKNGARYKLNGKWVSYNEYRRAQKVAVNNHSIK